MNNRQSQNFDITGENSSSGHRREQDTHIHSTTIFNGTGGAPLPGITGRAYSGPVDLDDLIFSLRELFAHDRQIASQQESKRCGICYLYFTSTELHYREDGFYVCVNCARLLGKHLLPMVRRQQK